MSLQEATDNIRTAIGDADSKLGKKIKIDMGDEGKILIDMSQHPHVVSNDDGDADCTMKIGLEDYMKMQSGELNGQMAFMTGKLKIEGDMGAAMAFGQFLESRQ